MRRRYLSAKIWTRVELPAYRGVAGALVSCSGVPSSEWDGVRSGSTDGNGVCELKPMCRAPMLVSEVSEQVTLSAFWHDQTTGVTWTGASSVDVRLTSGIIPITYHKGVKLKRDEISVIQYWLPPRAAYRLGLLAVGRSVLDSYDEALTCLENSLPSAALAMTGRCLEDVIFARGRDEGWWDDSWSTEIIALGTLLKREQVVRAIDSKLGLRFSERLSSTAVVRNAAVHQRTHPVTIEEAAAAIAVLRQLIDGWWGGPV